VKALMEFLPFQGSCFTKQHTIFIKSS
jgi:hypothetical protein